MAADAVHELASSLEVFRSALTTQEQLLADAQLPMVHLRLSEHAGLLRTLSESLHALGNEKARPAGLHTRTQWYAPSCCTRPSLTRGWLRRLSRQSCRTS